MVQQFNGSTVQCQKAVQNLELCLIYVWNIRNGWNPWNEFYLTLNLLNR